MIRIWIIIIAPVVYLPSHLLKLFHHHFHHGDAQDHIQDQDHHHHANEDWKDSDDVGDMSCTKKRAGF